MAFCLLDAEANRFKELIAKGDITPDKLTSMSSEKRRKFFSQFTDTESNAKALNTSFENTLLRKNQDKAILSWAKKQAGIPDKRKQQIQEAAQKRADNKDKRIFDPEEEDAFLEDLAQQRLGIGVSREEAAAVFRIAKSMEDGQQLLDKKKIKAKLEAIGGLVDGDDKKLVDDLLDRIRDVGLEKETRQEAKKKLKQYFQGEDVPKEVLKDLDDYIDKVVKSSQDDATAYGDARVELDEFIGQVKLDAMPDEGLIVKAAGAAKASAASFDVSFAGRQGLPVLARGIASSLAGDTRPLKAWMAGFFEQFKIASKVLGVDNSSNRKCPFNI